MLLVLLTDWNKLFCPYRRSVLRNKRVSGFEPNYWKEVSTYVVQWNLSPTCKVTKILLSRVRQIWKFTGIQNPILVILITSVVTRISIFYYLPSSNLSTPISPYKIANHLKLNISLVSANTTKTHITHHF